MINPMLHDREELMAISGKAIREDRIRNGLFVEELNALNRAERSERRSRPVRFVARIRVALSRA